MKQLIVRVVFPFLVFVGLLLATCIICKAQEVPTVNLPKSLWKQNWAFTPKQGSCAHASAMMLWRWQGQIAWSNYWGQKYYHGEYAERFHDRCDQEGVTYCDTYGEGDVSHLEWAIRTRRGAIVAVSNGRLYGYNVDKIAHVVCLVHLDAKWAGILDNNDTGQGPGNVTWVPRDAFLNDWLNFGSWAWTPVSTPPAPPQLIAKTAPKPRRPFHPDSPPPKWPRL